MSNALPGNNRSILTNLLTGERPGILEAIVRTITTEVRQTKAGAASVNPGIKKGIYVGPIVPRDAIRTHGKRRMNLWLYTGSPPAGNSEVEVIIKNFQFVPLDLPRPALLKDITRLANGLAQFSIQSQPDRRYQIQTTTNLIDWQEAGVVLATNVTSVFMETNSSASGTRYFRAITLP